MIQIQGNRVLVKKLDAPKPKSQLLEVVSLNEETSQYAMVIAVGNGIRDPRTGARRELDEMKPGDTIITTKFCGTPVQLTLPGDTLPSELHIIEESDALAVVEG